MTTASIALLWDPASGVAQLEALQAAGDQLGLKARTLKVSAVGELEEAFATASRDGVDALLVLSSPLFGARPSVLAGLALRHKLPTVTLFPDFARAGGLIAYGPNLLDTYRPLGPLVGKILHGAKPADLPVERPSKFELVVNVKTAKEIGVTIPTSLLLRADAARISPGPEGERLCRGRERGDRIPLGRDSTRSVAGVGGRTG